MVNNIFSTPTIWTKFVDIDLDTLNYDLEALSSAITEDNDCKSSR